jgi:hypothetical protein
MKKPTLITLSIIIVLVAIYGALTLYARNVINAALTQNITRIMKLHPNVKAITYKHLSADAFSIFTHRASLTDVTISFMNKSPPLKIGSILVRRYEQTKNQVPRLFDISLANIHATSFAHPHSPAAKQPIHITILAHYRGATQNLHVGLNVFWNKHLMAHDLTILNGYHITQALADGGFVKALQHSYVASATFTLDQPIHLNKKNTHGMVVMGLNMLGYQQLNGQLTGHSSYSDKTKVANIEFTLKAQHAADMHVDTKTVYPTGASLAPLYNFITTGKMPASNTALKALHFTYIDHGLIAHIATAMGQLEDKKSIQEEEDWSETLRHKANQAVQPKIKTALMVLSNFMHNPTTLMISLTPAKPVPLHKLKQAQLNFINHRNADEIVLSKKAQARVDAIKRVHYEKLIVKWMDTLGFALRVKP